MPDDYYRDLLISKDDMTLDANGEPVLVTGRACIAQDIQHMIRESGLLVELVGERDGIRRKTNIVRAASGSSFGLPPRQYATAKFPFWPLRMK